MFGLWQQALAGGVALGTEGAAIRRGFLGENHRDYAQSLFNLAVQQQMLCDYGQALPLLEQARDIWKQRGRGTSRLR